MRECSKGGCELSKLSSKLSRRAFLASSANGLALAASAKLGYPLEYPLIRAEGSHRDLGRQHGEQVSGKIQAHLNLMMASGRLSREELRSRALRFQPLFEKYCPHLLDEIGGLAEGARITLAEALAVNIRGELSHAPQGVAPRTSSAGREPFNERCWLDRTATWNPPFLLSATCCSSNRSTSPKF